MKVFLAHSARDRDLVASLAQALREHGYVAVQPFAAESGPDLLAEISASIRSADAMVAILTSPTPNVFYELGLAAGANIPTLLAAPSGSVVPADVAAVPFVQLSEDPKRDAQRIVRRLTELREWAPATVPVFDSAASALRAAAEQPALLESMSPADFERAVMEFFKEHGYSVLDEPSVRDTGVDFVMESPTGRQRILVEVKKLSTQGRVSVDTVRRLQSTVSLLGASLGLVVASSGYTAAAAAMAAGAPILLRTLRELVASQSDKDLLVSLPVSANEP